MKDDDSLEDEDPFVYDPTSIPFGEKDEMMLRDMMGEPIVIDLDWYPEQYEDQEEPVQLNRETIDYQALACECMDEIKNLDDNSPHEKLRWNQDMADHVFVLVPTEIHMVQGPTGMYPRFWGYICQVYPEEECVGVKKATISLPAGLFKRIEMFSGNMLNTKVNPLEDSKVHMISTTYHGLQEYEIDDEKRKSHKFWMTRIIEGHRSEN